MLCFFKKNIISIKCFQISRIDDYISRRLNICMEDGQFVHLVYAETDIDRVSLILSNQNVDYMFLVLRSVIIFIF